LHPACPCLCFEQSLNATDLGGVRGLQHSSTTDGRRSLWTVGITPQTRDH